MSDTGKDLRLIFSIIGIPLLIAGVLVTWFVPRSISRDIARIEALTPVRATVLSDSRPGREALVEGWISDRNPAQLETYVAYIVEELETDSEGDESWEYQTSVTPPLLIELSDGLVQIENYDISSTNNSSVEEGDIRYRGLEAGDPVIAVGILAERADYPRLNGEFVAYGSQADYIAAQRRSMIFWIIFGLLFACVGGIFMAVVLMSIIGPWWRRRQA